MDYLFIVHEVRQWIKYNKKYNINTHILIIICGR